MAARAAGDPSLGAWLRYSVGGRLPRHVDWVRHDLTDAGWRWRLLGRVGVQLIVPVLVAVAAALTLPPLAGVLLVLLLVLSSLGISAIASEQLRDRRLQQHGLPVPRDADEEFRNRPRPW